ncbi:ABC transporter permease [Streptomyces sp. Ru71]|uniref:ABC transporter permease n=1 Tax=Streptomyces sp. Ru71 TaxID=2080746 RepID=UPI000CDD1290|nr:ABC transporter permease [Streptomyces sp. Ru71]POX52747.1 ABC transporter permease [Streptomyces sp. Ru71]
MSATITPAAPAVTEPERTARPLAVLLTLARFEARELLLYVPVFVFLLLYTGYTAWQMAFHRDGMDDYPVLQDVDRAGQTGPLLVAIAVFLCVNRAALRSHRHGTDRHFDTLPVPPWQRILAHALSVVPIAAVVALVVTAEYAVAALQPGAVGHGSVAELAVGPLSVLLAGVLGVLLARLVRSSFPAPLFVIGLYAFVTLVAVASDGSDPDGTNWLSPVVSESGGDPVPSDLLGRPAGWHALYLLGLTVVLLCAAVFRSGLRTRSLGAVTALAVAATAAGIAGQSATDPQALLSARTTASLHPEKEQRCVPHGTNVYCAFPEWTGRTADWAAETDRVQQLAGGAAEHRRLTVRQRIDARYGLTSDSALTPLTGPGQVTVGTRWGGNRVPEFAVGVASVLVAGDEKSAGRLCDARTVTVMWLALAAQPDPMTALRDVRLDDSTVGSAIALAPTEPVSMSAAQTDVVRELLTRPRAGVAASVKAHWAELTSPRTSLARVAQLLGVPAPAHGEEGDSCDS